ncbi:hypothetical protein HanXRQr2_Chr02g0058561 [Helianthus annuus]|uniref:Uncharacterized protein n=1 Tax=Helianthus annuus TaxID=4232 RepID=A0A251VEU9_HELAN|nr:hypothetical protein HanXRQr2_Chr02g0058561 [Helianthus annuus]
MHLCVSPGSGHNVSTSCSVQGFSHRNCSIAQHHYLFYFGKLSTNKRWFPFRGYGFIFVDNTSQTVHKVDSYLRRHIGLCLRIIKSRLMLSFMF